MSLYHELVAAVFKLINLGILAGIAGYLFMKYGRTAIADGITRLKRAAQDRADHLQSLQREKERVLAAAQAEDALGRRLCESAALWREAVERARKDAERVRETYAQQARGRARIQQEYLSLQVARRRVLPEAISDAEQVLRARFKDLNVMHVYTNKLLTLMRGKHE